jgi:hypothetical protein
MKKIKKKLFNKIILIKIIILDQIPFKINKQLNPLKPMFFNFKVKIF